MWKLEFLNTKINSAVTRKKGKIKVGQNTIEYTAHYNPQQGIGKS